MESLKKYTCEICGGELHLLEEGHFICQYCKTEYFKEKTLPDELLIDLRNAVMDRKTQRFENALDKYDVIISQHSDCYDAYWGACLSDYGIQYEEDYDGKMIPTVHRYSEISVYENRYYTKAIKYCQNEKELARIKASAAVIEGIRTEIGKTIGKQKPYDIFLCYKETPVGKDDGYTSEYHWAAELYGKLQGSGYRVFFAKESLPASKGDYEAHIFPALKSAKLMLILTTSVENVESVWVKNEWSRFIRFAKEDKSKRFKVILSGVKPENLPRELRKEQALNHDSIGWVEQLYSVINDTFKDGAISKLDKIEIKGGQIAKKATQISNETLKTKELGAGAVANTSITEQQELQLAEFYLQNSQWNDAENLINDILKSNPNYAEALWASLQIKYYASDDKKLFLSLYKFTNDDYACLEKALNYAKEDFAKEKLNVLYKIGGSAEPKDYCRVLKIILPYNFPERRTRIDEAFEIAISKSRINIFNILLSTLDRSDVDSYIKYNLSYAENAISSEERTKCINDVLNVDAGNIKALDLLFDLQWKLSNSETLIASFENMLKYSKDVKKKVVDTLSNSKGKIDKKEHCVFLHQVLKYYPNELKEIEKEIVALSNVIIQKGFYEEAEKLVALAVEFSPNNKNIYLQLCLIKTKSKTFEDIVDSNIILKTLPEYTKYMTLVDDETRKKALSIAKNQEENLQRKIEEERERKEQLEKQKREEEKRKLLEEKRKLLEEKKKREELERKRKEEADRLYLAERKRREEIKEARKDIRKGILSFLLLFACIAIDFGLIKYTQPSNLISLLFLPLLSLAIFLILNLTLTKINNERGWDYEDTHVKIIFWLCVIWGIIRAIIIATAQLNISEDGNTLTSILICIAAAVLNFVVVVIYNIIKNKYYKEKIVGIISYLLLFGCIAADAFFVISNNGSAWFRWLFLPLISYGIFFVLSVILAKIIIAMDWDGDDTHVKIMFWLGGIWGAIRAILIAVSQYNATTGWWKWVSVILCIIVALWNFPWVMGIDAYEKVTDVISDIS